MIITVRGEPTNVLLSYKEYVRVFKSSDNRKTATELFAHKKAAYCDLESELVRNKSNDTTNIHQDRTVKQDHRLILSARDTKKSLCRRFVLLYDLDVCL